MIVNIILFTSAICFATSVATSTGISVTSATSAKSKRVIVDPDHNIHNNQEQSRGTQTTSKISLPQDINSRSSPRYGNAKATDPQRVSYSIPNRESDSHAYGSVPKRPLSYISSPVHQVESHRSNMLAPYFGVLNNPDAYKAVRSAEKPLDAPKSIVSQSLQKLQGTYSPNYNAFQDKPIELTGFSDFEYPSYSTINKLIAQAARQNDASSPTVQVPVYKMSYPLSKATDYAHIYAPSISTVSSVTPSSDKTTQSPKQNDEATVDVNGKKISVPIIQLQSNLDFSEVLPAFESQPFLLSANYPTESDVVFKFGGGPKFNAALQSKNVSPFSSPLSSFQGQVVPIQTINGNPQFPQYKGASIETYPVPTNVPKTQGNYESLYSQPQLHFGKEHNSNVQPLNVRPNTVPFVSTQDILNDVELVNKKNPEPHTPQLDADKDDDNDEDKEDEMRYKSPEKEYENSSEDDDVERQQGKYFKEPPTESDFKPSTFYPFKEYDERFGKHRTQTDDDDSEDKPYSRYKNYSSSDDEEEEDPSSEYRAEYTESSKPSHDSYEEKDEEEEEEESRKQERREEAKKDFYEMEPQRSKYYQKDFEQEFEDSYREELPKQEYVHVKEVPEIDSYIDSKPKQEKNNNRPRVNQRQLKEAKSQESRVSLKNHKIPKVSYKDSTAYGSDISVTKSLKVYEGFFGNRNPETGKYSKHAKPEKFLPIKKSPKEDDYSRSAKYYKYKSPKTGNKLSKDKNLHLYSRSSKNSPEETAARSNVRQLTDSSDRAAFYGPIIVSGQVHSLTDAEIFRDLTGI
ncbi:uncharacterized protein LOC105428521 [Pogonomyrmex barbatus]|uniref:Uncharacterized protein LOC105428521 n=1 Tax=Pogonomyrmex barbatus TaxID=144034 RepID=A0A6I9WAX1_9HYME|nr:uncharacterized protein LOC105428521 [Pogonomyrmex barbatus]